MKVREIMSVQVEKVDFNATVSEATDKMRSFDIGVLPVEKGDRIVGIITDRDIAIRAVARHLNPETTAVNRVMTSDVKCCFEDDDIEEAAKIMEDRQIRRLLVPNSDNQPAGILSLSDLAVKAGNEHLACKVLEKVCEAVHTGW